MEMMDSQCRHNQREPLAEFEILMPVGNLSLSSHQCLPGWGWPN